MNPYPNHLAEADWKRKQRNFSFLSSQFSLSLSSQFFCCSFHDEGSNDRADIFSVATGVLQLNRVISLIHHPWIELRSSSSSVYSYLTAANKTPDKLDLVAKSPMIFPLSYSSLPPRVEDLRRRRLQQSQLPNAHMKLYDDLLTNGIVDQLVDKGVIEDYFSLCYGGMEVGGGAMVLGKISPPAGMVFSRWDPFRR
ncbi:hypothetical protein EUTSA_v10026304mg [Eutrema salsugineum]|uniref:Uncharacterized protein n=1 Tax=Eutrema salsugineum TaxID=72664 RepID=V4LU20_EUTSA|nr:hypothetical protein EUTSA_v10026304mg [Eutrema salsugineum]